MWLFVWDSSPFFCVCVCVFIFLFLKIIIMSSSIKTRPIKTQQRPADGKASLCWNPRPGLMDTELLWLRYGLSHTEGCLWCTISDILYLENDLKWELPPLSTRLYTIQFAPVVCEFSSLQISCESDFYTPEFKSCHHIVMMLSDHCRGFCLFLFFFMRWKESRSSEQKCNHAFAAAIFEMM